MLKLKEWVYTDEIHAHYHANSSNHTWPRWQSSDITHWQGGVATTSVYSVTAK